MMSSMYQFSSDYSNINQKSIIAFYQIEFFLRTNDYQKLLNYTEFKIWNHIITILIKNP